MREFRTYGSVGGLGGQPPRPTRRRPRGLGQVLVTTCRVSTAFAAGLALPWWVSRIHIEDAVRDRPDFPADEKAVTGVAANLELAEALPRSVPLRQIQRAGSDRRGRSGTGNAAAGPAALPVRDVLDVSQIVPGADLPRPATSSRKRNFAAQRREQGFEIRAGRSRRRARSTPRRTGSGRYGRPVETTCAGSPPREVPGAPARSRARIKQAGARPPRRSGPRSPAPGSSRPGSGSPSAPSAPAGRPRRGSFSTQAPASASGVCVRCSTAAVPRGPDAPANGSSSST